MVVIRDGVFDLNETEIVKLNGDYDIIDVKNDDPHALDGYSAPYDPKNYRDPENIPLQAIYFRGRVLVRKSTENIDSLLKLCIRYTHDSCEDMKDQMILINKQEQYRSGTICPSKKTMFIYQGKVFVYYGRYIFGYSTPHVIFKRLGIDKQVDVNKKACVKKITKRGSSGFFGSFAFFLRKSTEMEESDEEFISSGDESYSAEEELQGSDVEVEEYDEEGYIVEKRYEDKITDNKIVLNTPDYGNDGNDYVYSLLIYDKETEVVDAFGMYR